MKPISLIILIVAILLQATSACSQVVINEYLASNIQGIVDEDGDTSDWMELLNIGVEEISLEGWALSDDRELPLKWIFPPVPLQPGEHLLLFASGKDRRGWAPWAETVITQGDTCSYRVNDSPPPTDWIEPEFDAAGWERGATGIGYGDGDDATVIPPCISLSVLMEFPVSDPALVGFATLHMDYDDGFIAWLNGVEIARANLHGSGPVEWDQPADMEVEPQIIQGGDPGIFNIADPGTVLRSGVNVLAIEVHNRTPDSSDLSCIPFLTLGLPAEPDQGRGVPEMLDTLLPALHLNFKLATTGERVLLSDPLGFSRDLTPTNHSYTDISLARSPDGEPLWGYCLIPTPGEENPATIATEFAPPPMLSLYGGFHPGPVAVTCFSMAENGTLHFTLDGSEPDSTSPICPEPIVLDHTTVIRTRCYSPGMLPSPVITQTYIIDDPSTLPVTSLTTDPANLWDEEIGIFVEENIWENWERPVHVEFFEINGDLGFKQDAGARIFGSYTRTYPQKSLRLIAREGYGQDTFDYQVFPDLPIHRFKQLVWRNSGNDWCQSGFRDGLMHAIASETEIDRLAWRPSRVYLNGEYYGILNIRERLDGDYLSSHHPVDGGSLDLIKNYFEMAAGDGDHYFAMLDLLATSDIDDPAVYAQVAAMMDIGQFIDYEIYQIFYGNNDWPGNNIARWRPRGGDDLWRWIMYDTDFGLSYGMLYHEDTLSFALEPDGPAWPNPPHSTLLLRTLMESDQFRREFINRYCDHLGSWLLQDRTTNMVWDFAAVLEDEMQRHLDLWASPGVIWQQQVLELYHYLNLRPSHARDHVRDHFGLGDDITLTVEVSPPGAGAIRLAAATVDTTWSATYFRHHPLRLTVTPEPGFTFSGWSDPELPLQSGIEIIPQGDSTVVAVFEAQAIPGTAVINEINYNSADFFDPGDWLELHNPGETEVDLGGWVLRDEGHDFVLPPGTTLPAEGFRVICRDSVTFSTMFPETPFIGETGFGFDSSGEMLKLIAADSTVVDSVFYDDAPPWPTEPDGEGPTLELSDPFLDNSRAASWGSAIRHGTPGLPNNSAQVGVDSPPPPPLTLGYPYPNPFNPWSNITFSVDRTRDLHLSIYDIGGRRLRQLVRGRFQAGLHEVTWNGRDDSGEKLPSGIYLLRMGSGKFNMSRKLILLK